MNKAFLFTAVLLLVSYAAYGAENLRLNPRLDYTSDSQDGPPLTGDHMENGVIAGKPNYVIIYGEGCFNSKHQARRTVELYKKYRGRVNFVIVDLDRRQSPAQQDLVTKYYKGYIPHVVVLDAASKPIYNQSGEVDESTISGILDKAIR